LTNSSRRKWHFVGALRVSQRFGNENVHPYQFIINTFALQDAAGSVGILFGLWDIA
jgi:hypothetical protein